MINIGLWYANTAVHLWRFYFRYKTKDPAGFTEPNRLHLEACGRAIKHFTDQEIEILNGYFMTDMGDYEDFKAVKKYAEEHGINPGTAWDVIKRANYAVIVERGLMDKKETVNKPNNQEKR